MPTRSVGLGLSLRHLQVRRCNLRVRRRNLRAHRSLKPRQRLRARGTAPGVPPQLLQGLLSWLLPWESFGPATSERHLHAQEVSPARC